MNYDMVFEGGGAKGMVFVGALQEIESRGHAPDRLMGASAGAIMATFLAAGYDADEMKAALSENQNGKPVFKGFLEIPPQLSAQQLQENAFRKLLRETNSAFVPDFIEEAFDDALVKTLDKYPSFNQMLFFFEYGGLYAGQYFTDWVRNKLNEGAYDINRGNLRRGSARRFGEMNLEQFYWATGVELSLVASDTTDAGLLVLNHRTAPDCPLVYAVRMSMSFPLLWQEVVWDKEWGEYCGKQVAGHTVVDGGMLSNFPIELFISNESYVTDLMGNRTGEAPHILGFLIDDFLGVPGAPPKNTRGILDAVLGGEIRLKTVQRIGRLINTVTQAHDKMVIDKYDRYVIRLPAKGYETTEFDMDDDRRNALVEAGRNAVCNYFDKLQPTEPYSLSLEPDPPGTLPLDFFEDANQVAKRILGF